MIRVKCKSRGSASGATKNSNHAGAGTAGRKNNTNKQASPAGVARVKGMAAPERTRPISDLFGRLATGVANVRAGTRVLMLVLVQAAKR